MQTVDRPVMGLRDHDDGTLSGPVRVYRLPGHPPPEAEDWEDVGWQRKGQAMRAMLTRERGLELSAEASRVLCGDRTGQLALRVQISRRHGLVRVRLDDSGKWKCTYEPPRMVLVKFGGPGLTRLLTEIGAEIGQHYAVTEQDDWMVVDLRQKVAGRRGSR